MVGPRERTKALAAVTLVQLGLGLVLLRGFRVDLVRPADLVQRLVDVTLAKPPPPPEPVKPKPQHHQAATPKAEPAKPGGTPGPRAAIAPPSITPVVAVKPSAAPSGGGTGTGPALGAGAGGGTGGNGYGDDEGGSDLEQIAGEITSRDYPRELREAGIGGRVQFTFTVEPNGRVGRCIVTRSSGVPQLDALTCRLVQQRFVYRPSTDRYGRPIEDEVDGEHDWVARSR
ncbi:TonB family protein [Sphingomonas sp.]|uniref:TonB family protein n=1 Tax=Sphingomonas sp. TaxID=28214 RepID=UPI0038A09489